MKNLLNHTSAEELKSSIKCSISNNRPFSRELLRASLDYERSRTDARSTVIKLLEAEIRRQVKATTSKPYRHAGRFGGAA